MLDDIMERAWVWLKAQEYPLRRPRRRGGPVTVRCFWLTPKGYDLNALRDDRTYARRSVLSEWLKERNYNPGDILSFEGEVLSLPERHAANEKAQAVCLRLWMESRGQNVAELTDEAVVLAATEYSHQRRDLSHFGQDAHLQW
jgi:hypothetical protein